MTAERVPWSFRALALCAGPLGSILLVGLGLSLFVGQGMEVAVDPAFLRFPMNRLLGLGVAAGLVGFPFLPLGLGLANLTSRPTLAFYLLAPGVPAALFVASEAWSIAQTAQKGTLAMSPFEQHSLFYLPSWITLLTLVAAFSASVWCYMRILRTKHSADDA